LARRKQVYEDGDIIYRAGDPADGAYEVLGGGVELLRDDGAGPVRAGLIQAGQMFGEMGLVGGGSRESTARALGVVQVRIIRRDQGSEPSRPAAPKKGLLGRLIEQIGGAAPPDPDTGDTVVEVASLPAAAGPGLIQRMMDQMQPMEGRIEARVAQFSGDPDGIVTRQVITAFDRFRDVHAKPLGKGLEVRVEKDLTTELSRAAKLARRWLRERQADILIWGHVPPPGTSVHLHFISFATWDERIPGGFDLTTDLPMPADLPDAFADFLHAATLAAAVPVNRAKASLRQDALSEAAAQAAVAMEDIPPDLTTRERAALYLCHGNILSAAWSAKRLPELLDKAVAAYRQVTAAITMEQSPLDWAMAHKHLANLLYFRTDALKEAAGYEESAASALSALEVFSKDETPYEWAALQHRLGLIHYKLGFEAGHTGVLRQALRCHQNALKVYSKRRTTARWAEVMSSFARAAQVFGEHVKSLEAMATAANAYHAVLQVRDRKTGPLAWAATQNNLGSALFLLGKKANNPNRVEAAIDAFEAALEVYELRKKHRQAAVTGKNLDRARKLLEYLTPMDYVPRGLVEFDGPFSEDPGSNLVDVSDIGADLSNNSTFH